MEINTNSNHKSALKTISIVSIFFAISTLYYHIESPDNIPWLRIILLTAVLLFANLISARVLKNNNCKLNGILKQTNEPTPEQIEESLRFAWSRPMVMKYLGALLGFSLVAALMMPAVWRGGFHTGLFILGALLCYAVVTLLFAVRIVYYRLRYGQWLFRYSAAKARELGHYK